MFHTTLLSQLCTQSNSWTSPVYRGMKGCPGVRLRHLFYASWNPTVFYCILRYIEHCFILRKKFYTIYVVGWSGVSTTSCCYNDINIQLFDSLYTFWTPIRKRIRTYCRYMISYCIIIGTYCRYPIIWFATHFLDTNEKTNTDILNTGRSVPEWQKGSTGVYVAIGLMYIRRWLKFLG